LPAVVGEPLSKPLAAFSDTPPGSVPLMTLQLYGAVPPLAPSGSEYATPTVPFGTVTVVITSGTPMLMLKACWAVLPCASFT